MTDIKNYEQWIEQYSNFIRIKKSVENVADFAPVALTGGDNNGKRQG